MKNLKTVITFVVLSISFLNFAQKRPEAKKIKITGNIIERVSKQVLEYATITFINNRNPKVIFGGITNAKGEFDIEINPGSYDVKIEFISFKSNELKQQLFKDNTNLGQIALIEDANQLNEVIIRSEKTTVEIKLDKKV